jgi:hypothetical protein
MSMQVYQELCRKHKTFRERSENVDLAVNAGCACHYAYFSSAVVVWMLEPFTKY